MSTPYSFYFKTPYGVIEFPITPGELTISNGSNNKTVTLINEGEVNILHSPSLTEVEFEARFPTRKYPYSSNPDAIKDYFDVFTKLKEEKKPFRFLVARTGIAEQSTGNTNLLVSLEELETSESADEGDDVIVSFKLKQYKEYGVIKLPQSDAPTTTSTSNTARDNSSKNTGQQSYTVRSGDCLWNIAKAAYGDGSKWKVIYEANKSVIEATAKKYGRNSSQEGHWIYPGTVLTIPGLTDANLTVQKLQNSKSSAYTSVSMKDVTDANKAFREIETTKCKVTVECNGIDNYAGSFKINHTRDGKQITTSGTKRTVSIFADYGTKVEVRIYNKLNCHIVSNKNGSWESKGGKAPLTNKYYTATSTHTISFIKSNASFTLKWVK